MIVPTEFVVAMRCAFCGKLDFHPVSRFMLTKAAQYKVTCTCGTPKLIIGTKNRHQYWLQAPCVLCETNHLYYYTSTQLWQNEVSFLYCNDTSVELGFFGPDQKVRTLAENYEHNLESLIDGLGYDDYFCDPEIMFEVLNCIHDIAEAGFLYCECGSYQVEIDIFPDKIELQCKNCKTRNLIQAKNEADLNSIKGVKKIKLARNGLKTLEDINKGQRSRKKTTKRTKR